MGALLSAGEMLQRQRAATALAANRALAGSRVGAPLLSASSSLQTLQAWLQANDPNGSWTDAALAADVDFIDAEPMTLEVAWEAVAEQLEGCE